MKTNSVLNPPTIGHFQFHKAGLGERADLRAEDRFEPSWTVTDVTFEQSKQFSQLAGQQNPANIPMNLLRVGQDNAEGAMVMGAIEDSLRKLIRQAHFPSVRTSVPCAGGINHRVDSPVDFLPVTLNDQYTVVMRKNPLATDEQFNLARNLILEGADTTLESWGVAPGSTPGPAQPLTSQTLKAGNLPELPTSLSMYEAREVIFTRTPEEFRLIQDTVNTIRHSLLQESKYPRLRVTLSAEQIPAGCPPGYYEGEIDPVATIAFDQNLADGSVQRDVVLLRDRRSNEAQYNEARNQIMEALNQRLARFGQPQIQQS